MNDDERLIDDFCALAGLRNHDSIAVLAPIEVDGILFDARALLARSLSSVKTSY